MLSGEFRRLSLQGVHVAKRAGLLFHWKLDGSKSVLRAADVMAGHGTGSAHAAAATPAATAAPRAAAGARSQSRSVATGEAVMAARAEPETQTANRTAREMPRQHTAPAAAEEAAIAAAASRVAADAITARFDAEEAESIKRAAAAAAATAAEATAVINTEGVAEHSANTAHIGVTQVADATQRTHEARVDAPEALAPLTPAFTVVATVFQGAAAATIAHATSAMALSVAMSFSQAGTARALCRLWKSSGQNDC